MTETTRTGFDAPAARDEDVLERWPFAERVYSLIKETPDDWSVRVAVLGPWGSGKSTVLDYVGELATADNFIVVRFNPWGFATPTEMFAELLGALGYEIEKHGEDRPRVEQLKAAIAKGRKKLSLAVEVIGGAAAVVSAGIAPAAGAKAVEKAVPLLTQAIAGVAPTASDIGKVAANAHRRVVVLLDDLDRADPATVKPLLWALRQLFDEAGLAFVLAIDPVRLGEIVTSAHGVQDGQDFLEKIIDFPRSLPTATNAQVAALARRDLRRWCPSLVPAVEEASAHLPRNPRKVRQIVRQLITVRTTLARFGDGEVDLVAFVLLSICRARWPLLAHVVLRDSEALQHASGFARMSRDDKKARDDITQRVAAAIQEAKVGVEDSTLARGLVDALLGRLFVAPREALLRLASLEVDPPSLTWREFVEVFQPVTSTETLKHAVETHAHVVHRLPAEVGRAVLHSAAQLHHSQLTVAAESLPAADLGEAVKAATQALQLIRMLLADGLLRGDDDKLDVEDALVALQVARGWSHFCTDAAYKPLRAAERALVDDIIAAGNFDPLTMYSPLLDATLDPPMDCPIDFPPWLEGLLRAVERRVTTKFFDALAEPDGFERFSAAIGDQLDEFLFTRAHFLVDADGVHRFARFATDAETSAAVRMNLLEVLNRIGANLHRRAGKGPPTTPLSTADESQPQAPTATDQPQAPTATVTLAVAPASVAIWDAPEIIKHVWTGATAGAFNPRFLSSLRETMRAVNVALKTSLTEPTSWPPPPADDGSQPPRARRVGRRRPRKRK